MADYCLEFLECVLDNLGDFLAFKVGSNDFVGIRLCHFMLIFSLDLTPMDYGTVTLYAAAKNI